VLNLSKFVSVQGTRLVQSYTKEEVPGYSKEMGSETDSAALLGYLTSVLPLLLFAVHVLAKYFYGANLSHSYLTISFMQIACVYCLYGIDLFPNLNYFYRVLFKFAHLRLFTLE